MVAALTEEKVKQFEELFANPTIPAMLEYPWQQFEGFVEYVFTCAGYAVVNVSQQYWPNGPGVDLELYYDRPGGKLAAYVEVRRYTPPHNIDSDQAHAFANKLNVKGVPGYIVTTSDFVAGARAVAAAAATKGRLRLVNGEHLARYIAYIRGSRIKEPGPRRPTTPAATPPDYLFQADAVARRDATDTMVLTIGNNRGGVAKTTTALNLALALAERKWRVLLVDMDPQSSLTSGLPVPEGTLAPGSLVDYFVRDMPLSQLVRRTRFTNVSLLPAHPEMRMADMGGGAHPEQELAFVGALHNPAVVSPDGDKFDWVILDTPPGQSFFTRSALAASRYVLVPAALDTWASLGMNGLLETAKAMHGLMGTGVEVCGCLLTRFRPGPVKPDDMSKFELDLSIKRVRLFETKIRHDDRLEGRNKEAVKGKLAGILEFAKQKGTGAADYQAALEELMRYVHDD
jgi:chromosome partitioning protein